MFADVDDRRRKLHGWEDVFRAAVVMTHDLLIIALWRTLG